MPCSPGMLRCKASCIHRSLIWDYRAERQRQEQLAEEASNGYQTELEEYLADHPILTFKEYLMHTKRT